MPELLTLENCESTVLVTQSCLILCNPTDCVAHQAPLSMEFFRQEYWSGSPIPFPGDVPDPWIEPRLPALWRILYRLSDQGSP